MDASQFKFLKWSVFNGPSSSAPYEQRSSINDYYEYFCSTKTIIFYAIFNRLFCLKTIFTSRLQSRNASKQTQALIFVCSTSNPFASSFAPQNNILTTSREEEEAAEGETGVEKQIKQWVTQRRPNIMSLALQLVSICLRFQPSFLLFVLFWLSTKATTILKTRLCHSGGIINSK